MPPFTKAQGAHCSFPRLRHFEHCDATRRSGTRYSPAGGAPVQARRGGDPHLQWFGDWAFRRRARRTCEPRRAVQRDCRGPRIFNRPRSRRARKFGLSRRFPLPQIARPHGLAPVHGLTTPRGASSQSGGNPGPGAPGVPSGSLLRPAESDFGRGCPGGHGKGPRLLANRKGAAWRPGHPCGVSSRLRGPCREAS